MTKENIQTNKKVLEREDKEEIQQILFDGRNGLLDEEGDEFNKNSKFEAIRNLFCFKDGLDEREIHRKALSRIKPLSKYLKESETGAMANDSSFDATDEAGKWLDENLDGTMEGIKEEEGEINLDEVEGGESYIIDDLTEGIVLKKAEVIAYYIRDKAQKAINDLYL